MLGPTGAGASPLQACEFAIAPLQQARSGLQVSVLCRCDDRRCSQVPAPGSRPSSKGGIPLDLRRGAIVLPKLLIQLLYSFSTLATNNQVSPGDMALVCVPAAQQLHRPSPVSRLNGSRTMAALPRQRCTVAVAAAAGPPIMVNSCTGKVSFMPWMLGSERRVARCAAQTAAGAGAAAAVTACLRPHDFRILSSAVAWCLHALTCARCAVCLLC